MTDWIEAHKGTTGILTTIVLGIMGFISWIGGKVWTFESRLSAVEDMTRHHNDAIDKFATIADRIEENTLCQLSEFEKREEARHSDTHKRIDEILIALTGLGKRR